MDMKSKYRETVDHADTVFRSLREAGTVVGDVADPSGAVTTLLRAGLSVPVALAHASGRYSEVASLSRGVGRRRTYQDWFRACDKVWPARERSLLPCWGWHVPGDGSFLVHAEGAGKPRCVAFATLPGGFLHMYDGQTMVRLTAQEAREAWAKSSDRSTVVTFTVEATPANANGPRFTLLQLRGA